MNDPQTIVAALAALSGRRRRVPVDLSEARLRRHRRITARYDAAHTSADNERHWIHADNLSADAANSAATRRTLRNRARYEVANNSYARGMVNKLACDLVGTGPRLQLLSADRETNRAVEQAFGEWAQAVDLPGKLRTMRKARAQDGEAFAVLVDNPSLRTDVTLDVSLVEADRVTTPDAVLNPGRRVDGIDFDGAGNPVRYHVLRHHPGDVGGDVLAASVVPAASMLHWFRHDRPGQHRGVPDLTPALGLFASLRRYREAVLAAAETAADYALFLGTDAPADGEADPVEPMSTVEIERRLLQALPGGWKPYQMKAEHPATNHVEYVESILAEIARCVGVPFYVAIGKSADYSYAGGRLDAQVYERDVRVEQADLVVRVLDRILVAWLSEYRLQRALQLERLSLRHTWFWDGFQHIDPAKEANAQATRMTTGVTNLAIECARDGHDWEEVQDQRLREAARAEQRRREIRDEEGLEVEPAEVPERREPAYADEGGASDG